MSSLDIVILGLSITSAWGNGHATTYRALARGLHARGHRVTFLERDVPWYAEHRDLPDPDYCRVEMYESLEEVRDRFDAQVRDADLVMVGSFLPNGIEIGHWVNDVALGRTAFYDIDTPVTLGAVAAGECTYMEPALARAFDMYLSFAGGPSLRFLSDELEAQARPLYCGVDPDAYRPQPVALRYDLGYLGTYAADRQASLAELLMRPARMRAQLRFAVIGAQYPPDIEWPPNVTRSDHLAPGEHPAFYSSQRFTLNLTRAHMLRLGYAPSVRLFEAAACATPVITDAWPGLDEFFDIGVEILRAEEAATVVRYLDETNEEQRAAIGERARHRVLAEHTGEHRAEQLERYLAGICSARPAARAGRTRRRDHEQRRDPAASSRATPDADASQDADREPPSRTDPRTLRRKNA